MHGGDQTPLVLGGEVTLGGVLSDLTVVSPHGIDKLTQDGGTYVTPKIAVINFKKFHSFSW